MGLPDILLALLQQPMSGSDLSRLFHGSIGHFWSADLSQIYRALDGLEREGCVQSRSVPSSKGPAKKIYRLTRRGSRRLSDWLARPPRIPAAKFEYLAQLFSVMAEEEPRRRAMELLSTMREEAADQLATLGALESYFQSAPGYPEAMPATVFYPWLTLRHGLSRRRALVEWIDESLRHLEARPASADADAGREAMSVLLGLLGEMNEAGEGRPPDRKERKKEEGK